jgi:ATP-dependent Lhr-like helicase
MRERRAPPKPGRNWGLPPQLAALDHVGKQLARKRKEQARAFADNAAQGDSSVEKPENRPPKQRRASPAKNARKPSPTLGDANSTFADASAWFASRGWSVFEFQRQVWAHILARESGMLHATTGSGKTYAVWLGILQAEQARPSTAPAGLTALWLTPMRALAADTQRALQTACDALGTGWTVGMRTGDTDSATRAAQAKRWPQALVTTPESLTILLTRPDARSLFSGLRYVVCDEWHELLGNKRGTQTMLAIARLADWQPGLIRWGLSATLGNLPEALHALMGSTKPHGVLVRGAEPKTLIVDTLIPQEIERFPWGGHLGTRLTEAVACEIEQAKTTIVFTNTRSQAEIWYQALLAVRPDWAGLIALHHGSLDKSVRDWVEAGLKDGSLKAVVSTSSLDLGVDFAPVERVLQIGSPKGVARLLQRAGRSGHSPGRPSRVTLVPTNALELVEAAAARLAVLARQVEPRLAIDAPFDVLVQHIGSMALGEGFLADELFRQVRAAWPYRKLTRTQFDWCLAFVEHGGTSLAAYPEHHRILRDDMGCYRMPAGEVARRHSMNIGTIVSDSTMKVAWQSGGSLGTIEESFIARLKPGDAFTFAGRILELVQVRDMTASVKKATRKTGIVPSWSGGRMSFSSQMADASLAMLARAEQGDLLEPEIQAIAPLLQLQARWSALPRSGVLVCEQLQTREGHHFFCYPFAGRMAHIGLGALLAWRTARHSLGTFSLSMNDYGFELLSSQAFDWQALIQEGLFSTDNLLPDVIESLNASELTQRRFREIARIAGLIFQGYPGAAKTTRAVQASSSLFYEVFKKHDAGNLLLSQAQAEALEQELEIKRLHQALKHMNTWRHVFTTPPKPTPFAFPLMVERFREAISTERLADRVQRMLAELEKAAKAV